MALSQIDKTFLSIRLFSWKVDLYLCEEKMSSSVKVTILINKDGDKKGVFRKKNYISLLPPWYLFPLTIRSRLDDMTNKWEFRSSKLVMLWGQIALNIHELAFTHSKCTNCNNANSENWLFSSYSMRMAKSNLLGGAI